ncbi:MAG: hypothetical protein OXE43_12740 [Chloroflexi bacterium]|nr:hypothetical protein [Chloroflexota bacterium]
MENVLAAQDVDAGTDTEEREREIDRLVHDLCCFTAEESAFGRAGGRREKVMERRCGALRASRSSFPKACGC